MSPTSPRANAPPRTAIVSADRSVRHFNQIDLFRRWNISARTLERWRWLRQGPEYLKIGGRVIYRLEDVEAFEVSRLQQPAAITNRSK